MLDESLLDLFTQDQKEKIASIQEKLSIIQKREDSAVLKSNHEFEKKKAVFYKHRSDILKSVPEIWGNAFLNHPDIAPLLLEKDTSDAFRALQDLYVEDILTDKIRGFKLILTFGDNEYFTNKKLEATLTQPLFPTENEDNFNFKSSPIIWKAGKNIIESVDLRNEAKEKKENEAKAKKKKSKKKKEKVETFFSVFRSVDVVDKKYLPVLTSIVNEVYPDPRSLLDLDDDDGGVECGDGSVDGENNDKVGVEI